MSKAIIEAVIKTGLDVPSLSKDETNKHGGFSYVGIDDFYEKVAKVALANGITWKAREIDVEVIEVMGSKGPTNALMATYRFDMMHLSGEMMLDYFGITIMHPLQGAQTAGSAMSYAEKQFMREVFKVVTGEADADATDNRAFEADPFSMAPTPKPSPPAKFVTPTVSLEHVADAIKLVNESGDAPSMEKLTLDFLPVAKTEKHLNDFWTKNADELKNMKEKDPPAYNRVLAAFKARKTELKAAQQTKSEA